MSAVRERWVELGVIGKPHGVRGEVRLFLHNPQSELLSHCQALLLRQPHDAAPVPYALLSMREAGGGMRIVAFADIADRDAAEALKGAVVVVARDDLPPPEDDEFYVHDLIGMAVWCDGVRIGEIISSRPQSDVEIVTVETEAYTVEIPLVDVYVSELCFDTHTLRVANIDGLPQTPKRR